MKHRSRTMFSFRPSASKISGYLPRYLKMRNRTEESIIAARSAARSRPRPPARDPINLANRIANVYNLVKRGLMRNFEPGAPAPTNHPKRPERQLGASHGRHRHAPLAAFRVRGTA